MAGDFPYERAVDAAHTEEHRAQAGAHHLVEAEAIAAKLRDALAPLCDRIELAGSIRRGVSLVKDIELVAIPKTERDLLGVVDPKMRTELDVKIDRLVESGKLAWRVRHDGQRIAQGSKFKALVAVKSGIAVDLFLVTPPASWGAIFAIRTGPWQYSRALVTMCQSLGLREHQGRLVRADGTEVDTPEEADFIRACGAEYVEPRERR